MGAVNNLRKYLSLVEKNFMPISLFFLLLFRPLRYDILAVIDVCEEG